MMIQNRKPKRADYNHLREYIQAQKAYRRRFPCDDKQTQPLSEDGAFLKGIVAEIRKDKSRSSKKRD